MANRNKPLSAEAYCCQQAGAALARHIDWRNWPQSKQVEYLFSFGSPHALYEALGVDSPLAQLYAACLAGRCGIFSLTVDGTRGLTIEVNAHRTVVQVRGRYNRWMTPQEHAWIIQWLSQSRLVLSKHVGVEWE
ncbi:hypothetical protein [Hymenobacter rubidus]|uniref:hypothetical protein n=1 Tax=Hymenobacter rubidus TaxID=1441626 RepID=UPI00191E5B0A|nr:hypothetical protein [Hymenobacter rubidus]